MAEFATKGVAGSGLGLGIAGTALGVLNGGLGNLFGGIGMNNNNCCSENAYVNRYELTKENEIIALKSENSLLKANTYADQKNLELYTYVDGRLRNIESQIASQAVWNATQTGLIGCMQGQIAELMALSKRIIPSSSVCPTPMPQYNAWVAPTTPTTGA